MGKRIVSGAAVLVLLGSIVPVVVSAENQDATVASLSWTVRTLYGSLSSRVGNPPDVLVYEVVEENETGFAGERFALDRARTIAREGLVLEVEGRTVVVPPSRVELVEVFEVPGGGAK
jgi:hypothetical protein